MANEPNLNSKDYAIYLGCDGFGENLKDTIKQHLTESSRTNGSRIKIVHDLGCDTYFDAAAMVCKSIIKHEDDTTTPLGVLFCGTGMGVGIIANKFQGIRAATCENITAVRNSRAINNANVLCLGQLITSPDSAIPMVDEFLSSEFIKQPLDGTNQPVEWWSKDVEAFLSTSMDGINRVEADAKHP